VTPVLLEMAVNGNADGIYSVLEDGDSVNPQVMFSSHFLCRHAAVINVHCEA